MDYSVIGAFQVKAHALILGFEPAKNLAHMKVGTCSSNIQQTSPRSEGMSRHSTLTGAAVQSPACHSALQADDAHEHTG